MSPRRFSGWEPREQHTHYDADGNVTGTTVVVREAEWDDTAQQWALSRSAYRSGLCSHCGTHASRARDVTVSRDVLREEDICQDCRAIEKAREQYHEGRAHTDKTCDCDDQHFYVAEYVPLWEAQRRLAEQRRLREAARQT